MQAILNLNTNFIDKIEQVLKINLFIDTTTEVSNITYTQDISRIHQIHHVPQQLFA